jgi:uncharacterized protein YoxC
MSRLTSILSVTLLGDNSNMKRSMTDAQKHLKKFESSVKGSIGKMNGLFATLGVGLSVAAFTKMAQAAASDAKSLALMTTAIKNATGATDESIASSEAYIQSLSNQFGILDDDLRPALTVLTSTYGDLNQAQAALVPTLDLAAYAQVDATTAANALAKAQKGNYKQLYSLIPALRGVADPMAKLQELTKGSAEAAANTDPFKKLQVIFDNLQETIGQYLLPYIEQFTTWLNTEQGQATLASLANGFITIANVVFNIITWLSNNKWLALTIAGFAGWVKITWSLFKVFVAIRKVMKEMTVIQAIGAAMKTAIGPAGIIAALGSAALVTAAVLNVGNLFNDNAGAAPIIEPFAAQSIATPTTVQSGLKATTGTTQKVIKKTTDDVKKGIETLKKQLTTVRDLIKSFTDKFRNAVELSFGIIDRATGKMFRADRFVKELRRVRDATKDFAKNMAALQAIGGKAATPLLNQILGMSPEEGAAILQGFVQSPQLFQEAIALGGNLANTGATVGRAVSTMQGNQTEQQMLNEIKLLRADLASGKNTYNIKGTMTATEIVNAIRTWEKTNGKKVLVG